MNQLVVFAPGQAIAHILYVLCFRIREKKREMRILQHVQAM